MSTGKRLAKRSIIGTRVVAPGDDGMYYSGVIHAVKTPPTFPENNNCINLTVNTRYSVRFDSIPGSNGKRISREFASHELVGPGFRGTAGLVMRPGQKVYLTYNGREVSGEVRAHNTELDEVVVMINSITSEMPFELRKRLEEVRLLESRKSARLADQDTDFARLADMAGDRKKGSGAFSIDLPFQLYTSRKRRPSSSGDSDMKDDLMMDDCRAAMVLMSLSCSPHSPRGGAWGGRSSASPGGSSSGSWRSGTPSPPLGGSPASWPTSSLSDEGIGLECDRIEVPKKKKMDSDGSNTKTMEINTSLKSDLLALCRTMINRSMVFQCTWPGCVETTNNRTSIEDHVKYIHLGPKECSDHEEEFYYTETEIPPPPTLSHRDMCRPPHEDPDYQRKLVGSYRQGLLSLQNNPNIINLQPPTAGPITIPGMTPIAPWTNSHSPNSPQKHMKMSGIPTSPARRSRESKKCRKAYGMERKDQWCTQCKWKKACSRFE